MIFKSLKFWTLIVGLLFYVARSFWPAFPVDELTTLNIVLFVLGLIGLVVDQPARARAGVVFWQSLTFWQMVAGFLFFVVHFFFPSLPLDAAQMLGILILILNIFGINPELRARSLIK